MSKLPKQTEWILVGEVVATQGNKGEVKVIPHTDFPDRFFDMDQVRLFSPGSAEPDLTVELESCRLHKEAIVLKLRGIDSINDAEELRKMLIKVSVDELVPLPEGRHYVFQLIGLDCITTDGTNLGEVTDVLQTGANDVYVVKPNPGITRQKEILIPVIEEVVLDVNLDKGQILIKLMDGLVD